MKSDELLREIGNAEGDPALLALASVALSHRDLSNETAQATRSGLEAAAVPHWFDEQILDVLVDGETIAAADLLPLLESLPVVEPFPAHGVEALNVHEASRLPLRERLRDRDNQRFMELSRRCVQLFQDDSRAAARIEWIYHLLVSDPNVGADELKLLLRDWSYEKPEEASALVATVDELESGNFLSGKASLRVRLAVAEESAHALGPASTRDLAYELLESARALPDPVLEGDVLDLCGRAEQAAGNLSAARQRFEEELRVAELLAGLCADDPMCAMDIAIAKVHLGDIAGETGDLNSAQSFYSDAGGAMELLVRREKRASWLRILATVLTRLGNLGEQRGELPRAEEVYSEARNLLEEAVQHHPSSSMLQSDLASVRILLSDISRKRGELQLAELEATNAVTIMALLVESDPTNSRWQRTLGWAFVRLGNVAQDANDLQRAQEYHAEAVGILRRLADASPEDHSGRRELGTAIAVSAGTAVRLAQLETARREYGESLSIFAELVALDPANVDWAREYAVTMRRAGSVAQMTGDLEQAERLVSEAMSISADLHRMAPEVALFREDLTLASDSLQEIALAKAVAIAPEVSSPASFPSERGGHG